MKRLLIAILTALLFVGISGLPAQADTYNNARWPKGTVCVVDKTSGITRTAMHNVVTKTKDYASYTGVKMTRPVTSNPTCSGYKNRVIVKDSWWSGSDRALLQWSGGFYSYNYDDEVWPVKSPVVIYLNRRYSSGRTVWEWVLAHEFGHAAGLGHVSTCSSVMRSGYSKYTSNCPAPRFWTGTDRKRLRALYH